MGVSICFMLQRENILMSNMKPNGSIFFLCDVKVSKDLKSSQLIGYLDHISFLQRVYFTSFQNFALSFCSFGWITAMQ